MTNYNTRKQGTAARSQTIANRQAYAAKRGLTTNRAGHVRRNLAR